MTVSRRNFLRTGTFAALTIGLPLTIAERVLGQTGKVGTTVETGQLPAEVLSEPLTYISRDMFATQLNTRFTAVNERGIRSSLILEEVRNQSELVSTKRGDCFNLVFKSQRAVPYQETFTLSHSALGTFKLFLVPGISDSGSANCIATINRV